MTRKITISASSAVMHTIERNRATLKDADYNPLELVGKFHEILADYSLLLESLQGSGPGITKRNEEEDASEVLRKLRECFTKDNLHNHISNLGEVLVFAQICQDFKFICDNVEF